MKPYGMFSRTPYVHFPQGPYPHRWRLIGAQFLPQNLAANASQWHLKNAVNVNNVNTRSIERDSHSPEHNLAYTGLPTKAPIGYIYNFLFPDPMQHFMWDRQKADSETAQQTANLLLNIKIRTRAYAIIQHFTDCHPNSAISFTATGNDHIPKREVTGRKTSYLDVLSFA